MTRRAIIRSPSVIEIEDVPEHAAAADELLVQPDAVGVCGTDIELLDGTMAYLTNGRASYPLVPGHEWTGIVAWVGSDVTGFAVGDRVVGEVSIGCGSCDVCTSDRGHLCARRTESGLFGRDGAMATQLLLPARAAHAVPGGVDRLDAVLIEPLAVVYRGLQRVGPLPERIGIVGGGTIGLLTALVARALGVEEVVIAEREASRRAFAESLGFDVGEAIEESIAPLVVEASGSVSGLPAAMGMCKDAGTILLLGLTGKPPVVDVDEIVVRDLTVRGSLSSPAVWPDVIELVAEGTVVPSALVSHELPLDRVSDAFELVRARAPGTRKVVVHPSMEAR